METNEDMFDEADPDPPAQKAPDAGNPFAEWMAQAAARLAPAPAPKTPNAAAGNPFAEWMAKAAPQSAPARKAPASLWEQFLRPPGK